MFLYKHRSGGAFCMEMRIMFHHYITKYTENGIRYAEAWFQIDILGQCLCLSRKRIQIG